MGFTYRTVRNILLVPSAAFLGNWLGGQLRYYLTGESVQTIQFKYETRSGYKVSNIPVATKFYPSLIFAMVGKPRWLFALMGGVLTGSLFPDVFEERLFDEIFERWVLQRVKRSPVPDK